MVVDDQIKDEKLHYYINREAAKISALSSGKIDMYEYITFEKIFHYNQKQQQNKLNLLVLFLIKLLKSKQKQLKMNQKN